MRDQFKDNSSEKEKINVFLSKSRIIFLGTLLTLILVLGLIAYYRVQMQFFIGPPWDTYAFLANALFFAGKGIGYVELERPLFLSVLVSLIFRFDYISEAAIYYVDALIFVFGAIGLFLLLKIRFDNLKSFFGVIFYACSPIMLVWLGTGYTDISGISFSIWAVYLTFLAVNKNSKFFYLAFPMAMLAVLTRFNMAFIIIPIIFYIILNKNILKILKDIFIGIILALLVLTPFLTLYYFTYADPFFPFTSTLGLTESLQQEKVAYIADSWYFIKNIPNLSLFSEKMGLGVYAIIILPLIGLILYGFSIVQKKVAMQRVKDKVREALDVKKIKITRIKYLAAIILLLVFFISFGNISYIISDIIFFIICLITYNLFRDSQKYLGLDLMIAVWLIVFLSFHSSYGVKVDRYFLTIMAPLAYFVVLGLNEVTTRMTIKIKNINLISLIYPILIITLLMSAFSYIQAVPDNPEFESTISSNSEVSSTINWLKKYDPNYADKKMISDLWPFFSWDLKTQVFIMPIYNNSRYFTHELEKDDVYYYFSKNSINSSYYDEVARFGNIIVYKRNDKPLEYKPSVFYIGTDWQRYLEDVLDFKAYLKFDLRDAGRFGVGKSVYVDSYSAKELQKYPYLFLYNFKWDDRNNAEKIIWEYAENGGTVVIDASGNMEGVMYNLDNTIFLNTTITRSSLSTNPQLWISPAYINGTYQFSPFLSDGMPWFGATYNSMGNNKMEKVVTLDGNTLIGVQKVGKGKIIWIGYNFVWHAFFYENNDEKKLIQQVLGL